MKKLFFLFFALLTLNTVLVFSNGGSEKSESMVLRVGSVVAENHPSNQSILEFGKYIEEKTNGKIVVKLFANGVLGSDREMIEQVQQGSLDMIKGGGQLSSFEPLFAVINLPYIFKSQEHFLKVMNSDYVKNNLYEATADKGFITLAVLDRVPVLFIQRIKLLILLMI